MEEGLLLGQTNVQPDIQLESSRPAGSVLRKWVKHWLSLDVFTKLQMEMLRKEEGLPGLKTSRFLRLEVGGCIARCP